MRNIEFEFIHQISTDQQGGSQWIFLCESTIINTILFSRYIFHIMLIFLIYLINIIVFSMLIDYNMYLLVSSFLRMRIISVNICYQLYLVSHSLLNH